MALCTLVLVVCRIALIVNRRSGAGQVVNLIELRVEWKCHVVADGLKAMVLEQVRNIGACASEIIVDANDIGTIFEQASAQVRAEKTGASSH